MKKEINTFKIHTLIQKLIFKRKLWKLATKALQFQEIYGCGHDTLAAPNYYAKVHNVFWYLHFLWQSQDKEIMAWAKKKKKKKFSAQKPSQFLVWV